MHSSPRRKYQTKTDPRNILLQKQQQSFIELYQNSNNVMKRKKIRKHLKTYFVIRDENNESNSYGILPADVPFQSSTTPSTSNKVEDNTSKGVGIGLIAGFTAILICSITLATILLCFWNKKRLARKRALDCRKSPWTQRYRQEGFGQKVSNDDKDQKKEEKIRSNRISNLQPETSSTLCDEEEQLGGYGSEKYIIWKDTPDLEQRGDFPDDSLLDPSFTNIKGRTSIPYGKVQNSSIATLHNSLSSNTKRRTNLRDVWCSPILPSQPDTACVSPRARSSLNQNTISHPQLFRNSPSFTKDHHDCDQDAKHNISQNTSMTVVGLGLMIDELQNDINNSNMGDYEVLEDISPIEKTGELWRPINESGVPEYLICSADKYAALMPKNNSIFPSDKKYSLSKSSSDGSIYTAITLRTIIGESIIPKTLCPAIEDDHLPLRTSIKSTKRLSTNRRSQIRSMAKTRTSSSRLLDEIFDEKRDAKVTRTFTAAMKSIKKSMKARKPPLSSTTMPNQRGSKHSSFHPSIRSLARRSEIRRKTKSQFNGTSEMLADTVTPFVIEEEEKEEKEQTISTFLINKTERSATLDFHLPTRLSLASNHLDRIAKRSLTLSPGKVGHEKGIERESSEPVYTGQLTDSPIKPKQRMENGSIQSAAKKLFEYEKKIHSHFSSDSSDGDDDISVKKPSRDRTVKPMNQLSLTRGTQRRRSYSLDSCLSSAILGYLHTPSASFDLVNTMKAKGQHINVKSTSNQKSQINFITKQNSLHSPFGKVSLSNMCTNQSSKFQHKRISQLVTGSSRSNSVSSMVSSNYSDCDKRRKSARSLSGDYASPTMQVVALYDQYCTDEEEEDNVSVNDSEQSHTPHRHHLGAKSQTFFLS